MRLRQLHPGLHRPRGLLGQALQEAGLPIIGDDIKSQVGATIVHRHARPPLPRPRRRACSAPRSSTSAATWTSTTCSSASAWSPRRSRRPTRSPRSWTTSCPPDDVHVGPSDYVPWLTDRKWAHIRLEGEAFGDVPLNAELKLEVWDSAELGRHRHRRGAAAASWRSTTASPASSTAPRALPDEVAAQPAPRRRGARRRPRSSSPGDAQARHGAPRAARLPAPEGRKPQRSRVRLSAIIRRVDARWSTSRPTTARKRPAYSCVIRHRNRAGSASLLQRTRHSPRSIATQTGRPSGGPSVCVCGLVAVACACCVC